MHFRRVEKGKRSPQYEQTREIVKILRSKGKSGQRAAELLVRFSSSLDDLLGRNETATNLEVKNDKMETRQH